MISEVSVPFWEITRREGKPPTGPGAAERPPPNDTPLGIHIYVPCGHRALGIRSTECSVKRENWIEVG